MQIPFNVRLENPHVVAQNQVLVTALKKGPTGYSLNSSYKARQVPRYKTELGAVIVNLCRAVPGGILVFFPSYAVLASATEAWQKVSLEHTHTMFNFDAIMTSFFAYFVL